MSSMLAASSRRISLTNTGKKSLQEPVGSGVEPAR